MQSTKRVFDREYYFFRWYRAISFLPTAIFLRWGVSANAVTGFGFFCLLFSFALLAHGWLLTGALLYLIAYILDFVDGNIARYMGSQSNFGKMIDGLVDSMTFLLFIALGVGNYAAGSARLEPVTELLMGITTAFVFLLRVYFYLRLSLFYHPVASKTEITDSFITKSRSRLMYSILYWGKVWYHGVISAMPLLLLIAVLLKAVSFYLFGYFLVFICAFLFELIYGLRRIWLIDHTHSAK